MKIDVVDLKELETFLEYSKKQGLIIAELTAYKMQQELALQHLERVNKLAKAIKQMREQYHFKTDQEMIKIIYKYARQY